MATRKTNVKRLDVLYRLFDLLTTESSKTNPICNWMPDCKFGFTVQDTRAFMEAMSVTGVSKTGRQKTVTTMTNFARTLCNWDFRKTAPGSNSFICQQAYFNQGRREEIVKMVSRAPSLNYREREDRKAARKLMELNLAQFN